MRIKDGRVVINFIVQALAGAPLTVFGDGRQTRSFCYVDDLIEAMTRMMAARTECVGPINIGNPLEITVIELARRILRITNSRSRIIIQPLPKDDPPRRRPDISRAVQVLDWQPQTDLDAGLERTIEDIEKRLQQEDAGLIATRGPARAAAAPHRVGIAGSAS